MSPEEGVGTAIVAAGPTEAHKHHLLGDVLGLEPKTAAQRYDQAKALDLMSAIASTRLLIHEQATTSVPVPLMVVMVLWLTFLFVGFGLFASPNATVIVALALGAFSVAGAIFLILDMSRPYSGLIHVSDRPVQTALDALARP